jgi:K(+)-stimulated pyrophosphate-energized sodium pump
MHGATSFETYAIWTVLGIAIIGLLYALLLRRQVMRADKGTEKMQAVWNAIRTGANAYLDRQLKTILPLIVILTVALFFSVYVVAPSPEALERFAGMDESRIKLVVGLARAIAFIMGSIFSLAVGQFGMRMAVQGNVRVASAARSSFDQAVKIAYRSGTITGMLTDGLGLFGGTVIFIFMGKAAPDALLGFGFGGTLLALFMRVGGGIFTKAADVGADLVGKVEAGIPEDDPRNAAVIADQVGDNVGDCAGMAADIFESYEVTIVAGLILGLALVAITGELKWIVFPLLVRGIGVFASIIGTYLVRGKGVKGNAMTAINRGFYTSAAVSLIAFAFLAHFYMREWRAFLSVGVGIVLAIVIDELTKYFTDTHHQPVKGIARAARTGPATIILQGLATGYESSVYSVIVIALTILAAIGIYSGIQIPGALPAGMTPLMAKVQYVLYGVAMTGIGMLTLTGNNVAMDSYGPIVDNANGIGEMAGLEKDSRRIMADLDAVGNTTKAITKGVAIGSAVIAAVSLFGSFITDVRKIDPGALIQGIRINEPIVFIGFMIGGALPWLFSSLTIRAVSRAASLIVEEVRRQFHIPGLMEGSVLPDYRQVVGICTKAAQRELITLALLAVLTPIIVGLALQVEALGGFLAGAIISGQLLAVFMANAGGAWDNAKKTIEDEVSDPAKNTGKGSERHKASVVGDTVGDPLKDTAGPALNPMLKVINLVSLLAAPIMVAQKKLTPVTIGIIAAGLVIIVLVVWYSRRGTPDAGDMTGSASDPDRVP